MWVTHYANHGGASYVGTDCGAFCADGNDAATITYWGVGAALSFRLSTHYPVHSGGPSNGDVSGAFLCLMSHAGSLTYWDNGAALL